MKDISNGPHIETNSVLHALKDFHEFIQAPKKKWQHFSKKAKATWFVAAINKSCKIANDGQQRLLIDTKN